MSFDYLKALDFAISLSEIFASGKSNWSDFIPIAQQLLEPTIFEPIAEGGNLESSHIDFEQISSVKSTEFVALIAKSSDVIEQLKFMK